MRTLLRLVVLMSLLVAAFGAGRALGSPVVVYHNNLHLTLTSGGQNRICGTPGSGSPPASGALSPTICIPQSQIGNDQTLSNPTALSVSNIATCALDGSSWKCWGVSSYQNKDEIAQVINTSPGGHIFKAGDGVCRWNDNGHVVACAGIHGFNGGIALSTTNAPTPIGLYFGPFKKIQAAAGTSNQICFVADEKLQCMGSYGIDAPIGPNEPLKNVKHLVMTHGAACINDDQGVRCFDHQGEMSTARQVAWVDLRQLEASSNTLCAVMKNGAIDCENLSPNENDFISAIPTDMLTVDLLAMGESFACATENGGHVRCWGESSTGNLAPPTTLKEVVQIAAGPYHACAINKAHDVICWGLTSNGQTSPPLRAGTTPLMDVEGAFTSCQWNDVGIRCTDTLNSTMPAPDLSQVLSINLASDALTHTACAITQDPAPSTTTHVQCWGGGKEVLNVPSEVVNPVNLAVTENSACAVLTDGSMKCWGVNKLGPVPDTTNVQKVLMARTHGCLIDHFGFTCWGPGVDSGNLVVPEALKEPGEVIDFAITNTHTCVLTSHGTVQCWGDNYQHESEAPPLSHPTSLIAFLNTTCASDDNGITCWGAKPNFSLNETANTPVSHVHFNHSPNNTPP